MELWNGPADPTGLAPFRDGSTHRVPKAAVRPWPNGASMATGVGARYDPEPPFPHPPAPGIPPFGPAAGPRS